ncbi:MAG TPA: Clp protease N-terminal domain-containing protein [Streptosporangiaceae bacterium]|nr:Clp protease N-terminal domain-containing protein [Streptosporangiaceae bacterium]
MLERFHQDARGAVERARDEANRAGQRDIGSEHLLLGLLEEPGVAADALAAAGADAADLRARLGHGEASPPGTPDPASPPGPTEADALAWRGGRGITDGLRLTADARRALEAGLHRALRLNHRSVSSGHLLLGAIEHPTDPAVTALTAAGVNVGWLRDDVLRRMMPPT